MAKVKFPYGVSDFSIIANDGYAYVDRTRFLEHLDDLNTRYHSFLRPRRFGKSLALSVMEHYYGKVHKDRFEQLFGPYYIGQNPTSRANSYIVLKFDFSGVITGTTDNLPQIFSNQVKESILKSLAPYSSAFPDGALQALDGAANASEALNITFRLMVTHCPEEKLFVLIDEYDHFTNEIIAFNYNDFEAIVSQNGFVRKFYEILKQGTGSGVVDRIFITGVSPITLDSLTSGYNIGTDLTLDLQMHNFMGFTETEVSRLLQMAGVPDEELGQVIADVQAWYNGYRFSHKAPERLYNPDMVLYFASAYAQYGEYPEELLDANVVSDYGKMRRMFRVGNEAANYEVIEDILGGGTVREKITRIFSFERHWSKADFASLLFYMGLLTIKGSELGFMDFGTPNHVIKGLYYTFFQQSLLQRTELQADDLRVNQRVGTLALENDMAPLAASLELVLKRLDNRDARGFDEKAIKVALLSLLVPTEIYAVYSEYAIGQSYADIALFRRPPILQPKRQHLIELKYLRKSEQARLEEKAAEGRAQLHRYLAHPDIARHGDFCGWLLVVVGYEVALLEKVPSPT